MTVLQLSSFQEKFLKSRWLTESTCHRTSCSDLPHPAVERGASAVKRVETRLQSRLKNDMMASLLYISLNRPNHDTEECREMLTEATKV